jgi:uncharacterized protein (DUF488 family)
MTAVVTIGVYGWALDTFLTALRSANVGLVLDVRQRRGVRGSQYAWANAKRLESALGDAGIGYRHVPELAPTTELRQLQYREDERRSVGMRERTELASAYRDRFTHEILARVDLAPLVASLPTDAGSALLCVERDPHGCHRSLVAERLARAHGVSISHLTPAPGSSA